MSKDSWWRVRIGCVSAIVMSRIPCRHTVHDHNRIWIRIYRICDHRAYPIVWAGDRKLHTTSKKVETGSNLTMHFLAVFSDFIIDLAQTVKFKGAPPIAADPGGFPDFRIFGFFGKCRFLIFSAGIWGLGGFAIDRKWLWASSGRILSPFRAI